MAGSVPARRNAAKRGAAAGSLWTYALERRPPASRVSYTLGPKDIKLTVIHEVFEPGSEVDDGLRNGWPAILSSLKSWLETGVSLDMTRRWAREGR